MRIAVIGAGAAGLAALRHCISGTYGDQVVCYEKTDQIGGTWVYREETGSDRYGLPIHTSMYKSLRYGRVLLADNFHFLDYPWSCREYLAFTGNVSHVLGMYSRTNLPKEVMGYPDFPIPEGPVSYLTRTQILNFLNAYCDHFTLRPYIQLLHHVELVEPAAGDRKWSVKVKDLQKDTVVIESFDAVMVCNGHYFEPSIPNISGQKVFAGEQIHSHDYRVPELFNGKSVVVMGGGPSGMDLALEISKNANRVILSHRLTETIGTVYPENVRCKKADVVELTECEVVFADGMKEQVDVVFYCTGYKYSFPFLAESCGVRVDSNMVTPLWKHLVSIENPTLAVIGIPFYVCAFSMFDLQVQFVLRHWHGERQFPARADMLRSEAEEAASRAERGLEKRHFHKMDSEQGQYYDDLANIAGVAPLPPVLSKLHIESSKRFLDDLVHYRQDRYRIIDDYNFVQL